MSESVDDEVRGVARLECAFGVGFKPIEQLAGFRIGHTRFGGDPIDNLIGETNEGINVFDVAATLRLEKARR